MCASAGSTNGLKAGSQPSGTRFCGTTTSIDVELCDGTVDVRVNLSLLLTRLTETKSSRVSEVFIPPTLPAATRPLITTNATATVLIRVKLATRDSIEFVGTLAIDLFTTHPRRYLLLHAE
jgi:hypothetical protein